MAVLRRLPRHPHIISLLDAFRDQASPNLLLLVLEFADAGDLAQFLLDAKTPTVIAVAGRVVHVTGSKLSSSSPRYCLPSLRS